MNIIHSINADANLRDAIRDWDNEVSNEAAKLIREGAAPIDAIEQAKSIVHLRRWNAAMRKEKDNA